MGVSAPYFGLLPSCTWSEPVFESRRHTCVRPNALMGPGARTVWTVRILSAGLRSTGDHASKASQSNRGPYPGPFSPSPRTKDRLPSGFPGGPGARLRGNCWGATNDCGHKATNVDRSLDARSWVDWATDGTAAPVPPSRRSIRRVRRYRAGLCDVARRCVSADWSREQEWRGRALACRTSVMSVSESLAFLSIAPMFVLVIMRCFAKPRIPAFALVVATLSKRHLPPGCHSSNARQSCGPTPFERN